MGLFLNFGIRQRNPPKNPMVTPAISSKKQLTKHPRWCFPMKNNYQIGFELPGFRPVRTGELTGERSLHPFPGR